jgi:hypothetical protein
MKDDMELDRVPEVKDIAAADAPPPANTYTKAAQGAAAMAEKMQEVPNLNIVVAPTPIPEIGLEAFEKKINNAIKKLEGQKWSSKTSI